MRAFSLIAILVMATLSAAPTAQACQFTSPLEMSDIEHADAVVVGRLSQYERVSEQRARYARFRITVRQTLRGETPSVITVNWDNSVFALPPSMPSGDYLVALNRRSETTFTVVQGICSPPFLFEANSPDARAARRHLSERARRR